MHMNILRAALAALVLGAFTTGPAEAAGRKWCYADCVAKCGGQSKTSCIARYCRPGCEWCTGPGRCVPYSNQDRKRAGLPQSFRLL